MTIFEQIKNIPISDILARLGIRYKKIGATLSLYNDGKLTDGWKANDVDNFVTDFTGKRASGDQLSFIESYLNIKKTDAITWFKNNYKLTDDNMYEKQKPKEIEVDIAGIYKTYTGLNQAQIDYLKSRGIDYEKVKNIVKNNNGGIACIIYNEKGKPISINTRAIDKKEFRILAGTQSKGVYMGSINKDNKKVYVCEGMFDFLTLRQYTENVIGLKSANDGLSVVREFYINGYDIIFIPDTDEAGAKPIEILSDIKMQVFDLKKYGVKDLNEFLIESQYGEGILEVINNELSNIGPTDEFEIVSYEDTLTEGLEELDKTNPKEAISWGYEDLDNKIGYVFPGQLILIGGTTGTGKSTFTSEIAKNISMQGATVLKFTLEDRLQDRKKQDLFYEINRIRKINGLKGYPYNEFMSNGLISTTYKQEREVAINSLIEKHRGIFEIKRENEKQLDLENLESVIKKGIQKGCKAIILDHLQEFKIEGEKDRQDLKIEEMMYKIKNIARKYKITIFLIAHFKKVDGRPNENSFKDSIAVAQVPNKVLLLYRDKLQPTGITELIIAKNREKPDGTGIIEMNFDIDELKYTNIKSSKLLLNNPF